MSLCWNAPVHHLGGVVNLPGGPDLAAVGDDLGLSDGVTLACSYGNLEPQESSFQFENCGGSPMGNIFRIPSQFQPPTGDTTFDADDVGGLVSEDAVCGANWPGSGVVPPELALLPEQHDPTPADYMCDDDDTAPDMDFNQFLEILQEPMQDEYTPCLPPAEDCRPSLADYAETDMSPSLASGTSWELSPGSMPEIENRGGVLDGIPCQEYGRHSSAVAACDPGHGSNGCRDLPLSSQASPVGQGILHPCLSRQQVDESALLSDLEQVTTSSPSDVMNEPAISDDCIFVYDSRPAASSPSVQTVGSVRSSNEQSYVDRCRVVDLTDADSSDGEVCDEDDRAYRGAEILGKRQLPCWSEPDAKRFRMMVPSSGANDVKPFRFSRVDPQPVDLLKIKAEAPAPQLWPSAKVVATVPTDVLNKQIAAAGKLFRNPASSKLYDVQNLHNQTISLQDQIARHDSGLRRHVSPSLTAPPSGSAPLQFGGPNCRSAITNSVVNGVSSIQDPICEDEALRAVLRGFADGAHRDEAFLDEGLMTVPLMKHQRIALAWMSSREVVTRDNASVDLPVGGILADDQGLGKTISMISLILKNRSPAPKPRLETAQLPQPEPTTVDLEDDEDVKFLPSRRDAESRSRVKAESTCSGSKASSGCPSSKTRATGGTLVVCPTSVLRQWANELKAKVSSDVGFTFVVYHGPSRMRDPEELAKVDVVLTTYSILSQEVPTQPSAEELEEEKRNLADYGLSFFCQPKAPKKPDKAKKKSKKGGEGQDGTPAQPPAGPLAMVAWFRVILDEAQSIKNAKTQTARAAWGLRAKRRWCLSGTPIQNSIDDLYSYFRFLRYAPFDKFNNFRAEIKDPISRNPPQGYLKLQNILRGVLLRRTKSTIIDGEPIVKLPPRIVELQQAEFSVDERSFYTCLENESRRQFQVYAAAGTVKNNYVNILWMLLRLRQACDHRQLVKGLSSHTPQESAIEAVEKLSEEERGRLLALAEANVSICSICNDAPEEAVVTSCAHVFCEQCISQHLGTGDDATCPFPKCRKALRSSQLYPVAALSGQLSRVKKEAVGFEESLFPPSFEPSQGWVSSSKIDAVISTLLALPKLPADRTVTKLEPVFHEKAGPDVDSLSHNATDGKFASDGKDVQVTEKAIVFSQWTSMLDLLEIPLKQAGFCYRRLDGTMTVNARDRAVHEFNNLPEVNVIIMSLKAASLGLNMVSASHVLLMDVWWNPTTEDQAIDRAHRIGQTRTVRVSRFTVKNTIEDRILALQDRKRQMVASAFGETELGDQRTRLTEQDLRYLFRV